MSTTQDESPGHERSGEFISHPGDDIGRGGIDLKEVRYSLPVMLEELRSERRSSMFAMEILDQGEIERLFVAKRKIHGKTD